jgi:putative FmdB family regulatory protein
MSLMYDYSCRTCGAKFEALVEKHEKVIPCARCLGGQAERFFSFNGRINGKNKGLYPRFDTQLGLTLESSQHRDRVAKERGLEQMGPEEYHRSRHAAGTSGPVESDEVDPVLVECAKRAWDDVKFGRVPDEQERVLDIAKDMQADFLDATPTKEPS